MGHGPDTEDGDRELVNRLFALATSMLEDTSVVAAAGQSPRLNPTQLADRARELQDAARDIAIIAKAAAIVSNRGENHDPD